MITASRAEAPGRFSRCHHGPGPWSELAQGVRRTSASKWPADRLPNLVPSPPPCPHCPEQEGPPPPHSSHPITKQRGPPRLAGPPVCCSYHLGLPGARAGSYRWWRGGGYGWGLEGQADGDSKPYSHPKQKDPSQDGEGEEASSWVGSWVGREGSRLASQT